MAARILRPSIERAEASAKDATDRLIAAHQDGYIVPPSEEVRHVAETEEPLPPPIEEYVSEFDERGRAVYEAKARSLLNGGMEVPYVVVALNRLRFEREETLQ